MNYALPEGRAGQISAAGLALLALAALAFGVIAPLSDWYGARAALLQDERQQLAHMLALQRTLPSLRRSAAAAAQTANATVLLPGGSDAIAGAALQSSLQNLAARSSISLDSAEMQPADDVGALRRIGVAVSVTTTWPALITLLAQIDSASPRMIVDNLTINGNAPPDPRQEVSLQATFTVSAFRAGGGPNSDADGGS